jgi:hypothetical protein
VQDGDLGDRRVAFDADIGQRLIDEIGGGERRLVGQTEGLRGEFARDRFDGRRGERALCAEGRVGLVGGAAGEREARDDQGEES